MWARTTFRHTLRHSLPLSGGKLALSSGIALSLAAPLTARLFTTTASADAPALAECTRWLVHDASSAAPRECPTPLVLLRVPRLHIGAGDAAHDESFRAWADMFASRGYTAVEVDVTVDPNVGEQQTANGKGNGAADEHGPSFPEPIASAKTALNARLRLLNIPFAPIVVASGPAGLVAQAYVSDHAASGLVLLDPPSDADPRPSGDKAWAWPSFNFEPRFPILLLGKGMENTRVGKAAAEGVGRGGRGVEIGDLVDGVRGEKTRMEIERWMDRCGW